MIALQLAIKNVSRKKERSLLTIIGVLLAVGSFISLLSVAEGLFDRVNREINVRNADVYILPGDAIELPTGPIGTLGFTSNILSPVWVDEIKGIERVKYVCPIYRIQQKMRNQTVIIWGINSEDFPNFFHGFRIASGGRMFQNDAKEILIGGNLAYRNRINLQTPIVVEGRPFETVGIGVPQGGLQDYFCFISLKSAMEVKNAIGVQEIWVQVDQSVPAVRRQVAQEIRKKYPDVKVMTAEEYLGSAHDYINFAWLLQFAIAAIGVLIAMTAAMNTMLMSTYERIKEFGTLRAIGGSRFTVFSMIFLESLILCFLGGLGGVILGIMGSHLFDDAIQTLLQLSFPLAKVTPGLLIYAVLLSAFVGVVGAIIPAIIVYRMNIIDALRWE